VDRRVGSEEHLPRRNYSQTYLHGQFVTLESHDCGEVGHAHENVQPYELVH